MAGQIVEITQVGYRLSKSRGFLQVHDKQEKIGQVALDDIVAVIISVLGCQVSSVLIDQLSQRNIPLVVCGQNYLPSSFTLPLQGYGRQFQVMRAQVELSEPRRKRAWQQLVRSKIKNQAEVLHRAGQRNAHLLRLAAKVKSGDPENCEAQAARAYWQHLFGSDFRRDRDAAGLNSALNYIYAVLRACVARGVSAAGLHPSFSLHHKNPQNPLNLVDDLIEPFRPIADYLIWQSEPTSFDQLTPDIKTRLATIVTQVIRLDGQGSPLSLAAVKTCRALAAYCLAETDQITLPTLPTVQTEIWAET